MEPLDLPGAAPIPRPSPREVGVPRRFGVGSLLVVTAFFAALLGLLSALRMPPVGLAVIMGFFVYIGVAQAVLFGGKQPRAASIVAGLGLAVGLVVVSVLVGLLQGHRGADGVLILLLLGMNAVAGALFGYLAGALLAGVFLVMQRVDTWIHGPLKTVEEPSDTRNSPWDDLDDSPGTAR